jgi:hypothetical protein
MTCDRTNIFLSAIHIFLENALIEARQTTNDLRSQSQLYTLEDVPSLGEQDGVRWAPYDVLFTSTCLFL